MNRRSILLILIVVVMVVVIIVLSTVPSASPSIEEEEVILLEGNLTEAQQFKRAFLDPDLILSNRVKLIEAMRDKFDYVEKEAIGRKSFNIMLYHYGDKQALELFKDEKAREGWVFQPDGKSEDYEFFIVRPL